MLVRNASAVEAHPNLTIVEGSVLSEPDMDKAFKAAGTPVEAVLQFLNPRRTSDFPWAKFIGPANLLRESTAIATRLLRRQQRPAGASKPRLVVMSALGVGESRAVAGYIVRFFMDYSNVGITYEDHNAVDAEIEGNCGSDVLWTNALASGLVGTGIKPIRTFEPTESGASSMVTRESIARWMVDVATGKLGDKFSDRRVIVSN